MIELKGIVREYHNGDVVTPALTGIDLCIGKGEFAAVMGASGSGKTTLLHIMGCMDAPTSGIYRLDGEHLERASEKRLSAIRGQKISFVFQHFALLEDWAPLPRMWRCLCSGSGCRGQNAGRRFLRRWNRWALRAWPAGSRPSSRADRSSVPPCPGDGVPGRIFCWQMSPPARWIAGPGRRLWVCSRS